MAKVKFKVGDRVVGVGSASGINITGKIGTVVAYGNHMGISFDYVVKFDESHEWFHTGCGLCKDGYGWFVNDVNIKLIKPETIVIYSKGNQVIAHNKVTDEKGIAKCCPEDTFDFNVGAKLAFDRLMGVEEPKEEPKPEPEYKIGDLVEITTNTNPNFNMIGVRGEIIQIGSVFPNSYKIDFKIKYPFTHQSLDGKHDNVLWVHKDNFKKVD